MSEAALWLDGNAYAGLLEEVFAREMTRALRRCQSCGASNALGAHRAYRGAGVVLRCPACGDLAMRIALLGDRHDVMLLGDWTLDAPSP